MVKFMKQLPANLNRPEAILVINAHWEEQLPALLGSKIPQMLYDDYGSPEEVYHIDYPAPGNPSLPGKEPSLFSGTVKNGTVSPDFCQFFAKITRRMENH